MAHATPRPTPDFDTDESTFHDLLGSPRPSCPPLDVLRAYTEGVLPKEPQEAVRRHLAACRVCPLLLADVATLPEPELSTAQMERIRTSLPTAAKHAKPSDRLYAFAGIAAALLLAVFLTFAVHSRKATTPAVASVAAPHTQAAAFEIPLSPLEPPHGMITRGGASAEEPSVDQLMPAFNAYNSGDYAAAADRFTQLQSRYPHSETVTLYLGVAQLFLRQDGKAYNTLTSIQRPHPAAADALHWYTAVAAQRTHVAGAPQLFADICANKQSRWSTQSCNIESQLH